MASRKMTEAERAERRAQDRERLEHAVRALLNSEGWKRWVGVRSTNGLARYSFTNQILIAIQLPDASYVAGFRAFLALNRCVRKGERAIRIFAPMNIRAREADGAEKAEAEGEGEQRSRIVFRSVPVFDVSQTDPLPGTEPVPLHFPQQPITGSTHAHLLPPLTQLASELGYTVARRPLDGPAEGWCDSRKREIAVNERLPANAQVRVLVHEIAHALGIGYRDYGRRRAEVLVDTVTYIVCGSVGLDTSKFERPLHRRVGRAGRARRDPLLRAHDRHDRQAHRRQPQTPARDRGPRGRSARGLTP
jgi:hypothetical protein